MKEADKRALRADRAYLEGEVKATWGPGRVELLAELVRQGYDVAGLEGLPFIARLYTQAYPRD